MPPGPGRCAAVATAALFLAGAAAPARAESPAAREHLAHCWHLEHDYWELPREIAATAIWWRRQALQQRWEETRDRRRVLCTNGW